MPSKRRHKVSKRRKNTRSISSTLKKNGINNQEAQLLGLLTWLGMEYDFVGDGKLMVHGKCPDFVSKDGTAIIELYGERWHRASEAPKRIDFFIKSGFQKVLIIWGRELQARNRRKLVQKLLDFDKK